jgi:hypothetical protein
VIAWDEDYDGIRVTLQYMKERHGGRHAGTAIQRLRDDTRAVHVPQFLAVLSFVCACHDEQFSIYINE